MSGLCYFDDIVFNDNGENNENTTDDSAGSSYTSWRHPREMEVCGTIGLDGSYVDGSGKRGTRKHKSGGNYLSNRAKDCLKQAKSDLEHAGEAKKFGRHEWACFASHQSAKKAVKSLHLFYNQEAWGHVIARLLNELPTDLEIPEKLIEKARVLDNFYIPTRYPNGHPEGAPSEHYGDIQSEEAIRYAGEIFKFVYTKMA